MRFYELIGGLIATLCFVVGFWKILEFVFRDTDQKPTHKKVKKEPKV